MKWRTKLGCSRRVNSSIDLRQAGDSVARQGLGFDGCNRFSGRLDAPGEIVATRRGCPDATLKLPLDLNRLAEHIHSGKLAGGWLRIPARWGFPASGFKRRK